MHQFFLGNIIQFYVLPRPLKINQTICPIDDQVKNFSGKKKIYLVFTPTDCHRAISLVGRLLNTIK